MREFKFRAWFGGKMIKPMSLQKMIHQKDNTIPLKILEKEIIFMQYTGLLDKEGKETYEGDIIEIKNVWTNGVGKWSHFVGKIVFFECEFQAKDINDNYLSLHRYKSRIKVIGSIYENPELLEGKNETTN
jgi:uncharacterized phage protein (TIGR01671 family)